MKKAIKVLSLFDGISCAQVALRSLGYEPTYYASEVDKHAIAVTQRNHPNTKQLGDVRAVGIEMIGGGVGPTHWRLALSGFEHCQRK